MDGTEQNPSFAMGVGDPATHEDLGVTASGCLVFFMPRAVFRQTSRDAPRWAHRSPGTPISIDGAVGPHRTNRLADELCGHDGVWPYTWASGPPQCGVSKVNAPDGNKATGAKNFSDSCRSRSLMVEFGQMGFAAACSHIC